MADKILALLIFAHYLVFVVVFFFWYEFLGRPIVFALTAWKTAFPIFLVMYALRQQSQLFSRRVLLGAYSTLFAVLLFLAAVATLFSSYAEVGMYEWFKLVPRLLFFVACAALFARRQVVFVLVLKLIVSWSVLSVLQYIVLCITGGYRFPTMFPGMAVVFGGPLGILGNISSVMHFEGLPFSIVRLCGYWNEPSNASGSLIASFFFARILYGLGEARAWRNASYICLFGGFACLSNAGYAAFAAALGFGAFVSQNTRLWTKVGLIIIALMLISVSLFGRQFVVRHMPNNEFAKAFVGVRSDMDSITAGDYDASAGRVDLLIAAANSIKDQPLGVGVFVSSSDDQRSLSASAPVIWFTYAGIGGLVVLLAREAIAGVAAFNSAKRSPMQRQLAQAWIVVLVQQASYGIWMDPLYIIITAALLVQFPMPSTGDGDKAISHDQRRISVRLPTSPRKRFT